MTEIRRYQTEDNSALKTLMLQLQANENRLEYDMVEPTPEFADRYISQLLESVEKQRGVTFVAVCDDAVCGFGAAYVESDIEYQFEYLYISDLVVAQEYRDQGIGSRLIEALEAFARESGLTRLHIGVLSANEDAHRLYRKLGFRDLIANMIKPLV
jgi:ribosomal protein S18 acetylase RimI-like enzyme